MKGGSKWDYLGLLTVSATIIALIYVVVTSIGNSPWAIVAFIVLLTGLLLADKVISLYFNVRDRIDQRQAQRGEVIDPPYHVVNLPKPITLPQRYNVPLIKSNGEVDRGQALLTTATEIGELTCPVSLLRVAAQLLAEHQEPVRANFNAHGVMSSAEIRATVDFLRLHGWIRSANPNAQNSPARWVSGADADALQEFVNTWTQ